MAIHRKFVDKIAEIKLGSVAEILGPTGLNLFKNVESGAGPSLSEIEEILNTLDYLVDQGYVEFIQNVNAHNSLPSLSHISKNKNRSDTAFLDVELNTYAGRLIRSKRSLRGFINDGYISNSQRKERRETFKFALSILVPAFLTAIAIFIAYQANRQSTQDFQLRMRPYLIVSSVEGAAAGDFMAYKMHLKNVGILPAKTKTGGIYCTATDRQVLAMKIQPNVVGNGEYIDAIFSLPLKPKSVCVLGIQYSGPDSLKDLEYETKYKFETSEKDHSLLPIDAILN